MLQHPSRWRRMNHLAIHGELEGSVHCRSPPVCLIFRRAAFPNARRFGRFVKCFEVKNIKAPVEGSTDGMLEEDRCVLRASHGILVIGTACYSPLAGSPATFAKSAHRQSASRLHHSISQYQGCQLRSELSRKPDSSHRDSCGSSSVMFALASRRKHSPGY